MSSETVVVKPANNIYTALAAVAVAAQILGFVVILVAPRLFSGKVCSDREDARAGLRSAAGRESRRTGKK